MSKNNDITIKSGGTAKFKTEWVNKEGVFETPQKKFIVRVKIGRHRKTVGQYKTKEEADLVYNNLVEKEKFEIYFGNVKSFVFSLIFSKINLNVFLQDLSASLSSSDNDSNPTPMPIFRIYLISN